MGRVVVVSGLLPYDSGKTYVTTSLAKALRTAGFKVSVFKPVAAHSAWFQHEAFEESVALGVLVGEDVLNYLREGLIDDVDKQNPIDILTAPPSMQAFPTLATYLAAIESGVRQAVIARVSIG
ncbi:MAG: ATPase, partial [Desulfurococcales archaeon]|nr:ATPase [Desulfurococcales archaeon]